MVISLMVQMANSRYREVKWHTRSTAAVKWSSHLNPILTPDLIYLSPSSAPSMVLIFSHMIIPMALARLCSTHISFSSCTQSPS